MEQDVHSDDAFGQASAAGLLLLSGRLTPLHANREAIEILTHPENPRNIRSLDQFLMEKIQSLRTQSSSSSSVFSSELVSGRRRYVCRAFVLSADDSNADPSEPVFAVLLERPVPPTIDTRMLANRFRLTPRELETARFLLQGLTSKEIASRMSVSPNTVKAFTRLVLMKMGVSTRSAVAGKVLSPLLRATRERA